MKDCKWIDGILKCECSENCPLAKHCGGAWDYKQPNTKKLICLCNHIDLLAVSLYERDGDRPRNTISDYAYQMAWIMHNEFAVSVDLLQKWEEPKTNVPIFLECYEHFKRFVQRNKVNFLLQQLKQLQQIANANNFTLVK